MMLDAEIGCYHMKFGLKNPKRQDFKISFRNKGQLPLNAEFSVERADSNSPDYELMIYPVYVAIQPNGLTSTSLIIKSVRNDKPGESPVSKPDTSDLRCIIVAKFRNSSALFSYPCVIRHQY